MRKSSNCLFFARNRVSMYSLFLHKGDEALKTISHIGYMDGEYGDGAEITDENISAFCYYKLDDTEFCDILEQK